MKSTSSLTQNQQILKWLKRESITAMDAMMVLNVYRLAARIQELRAQGHEIETVMEPHEGGKHARYFLHQGSR